MMVGQKRRISPPMTHDHLYSLAAGLTNPAKRVISKTVNVDPPRLTHNLRVRLETEERLKGSELLPEY